MSLGSWIMSLGLKTELEAHFSGISMSYTLTIFLKVLWKAILEMQLKFYYLSGILKLKKTRINISWRKLYFNWLFTFYTEGTRAKVNEQSPLLNCLFLPIKCKAFQHLRNSKAKTRELFQSHFRTFQLPWKKEQIKNNSWGIRI